MIEKNLKKNYVSLCCAKKKKIETPRELFGKTWHGNVSPLYWRVPILLWSVAITTWSVTSFWGLTQAYLMYMTHWGLLLIIFESAFGVLVAIRKSEKKVHDATFGLPWYVKTYWVLYNVAIPVAFLITIFYWAILKTSGQKIKYASNIVLDLMIHGGNSLVMFVELVSSAHPSRLLHVLQPLYFALAYLFFTIVYYYAGGVDPFGNHFIYPVIDWAKPQQTSVVVILTALFLVLMHILVVAIAALRDFVAMRCMRVPIISYRDGLKA